MGLSSSGLFDAFMTALTQSMAKTELAHSGKQVVIDKITPYLNTSQTVVERIAQFFPDLVVLPLVRDGRDVVVSGVFDWVAREQPGSPRYDWFVSGQTDRVLERFFDDEVLQLWCSYWTEPLAALPGTLLNDPIRYEEMKQSQAEVLRRIAARLGLDSTNDVLRACEESASFQRMSGGREAGQAEPTAKVRSGIVGGWRRYFTRRDGELFHRLAGESLIELGYESDDSWIADLPDKLTP